MDTPSTPVSTPPPSGAFPEHNASSEGTSLIRSTPIKPSRHIILWLLVLVALGGAGFSGYMVMQNQATMATTQANMTEWATRLTALEQKLNSVSTKVDTLSVIPTTIPTLPVDFSKLLPTTFPVPTSSPSALTTPQPQSSSQSSATPGMTGDDSDPASVSDGQMTAEDEHGMLEFYMQSIRIGEDRTDQPEDISLVKNRQTTEDKLFNYDVFRNKETNELYIYARKSSTNATAEFVDGWYGPFPAFPGA